jgi:hypothetical protein
MSKEGPLWPEGLRKERKLPPVENQRAKTLTEGVSVPVAKELNLSKAGVEPVQQPVGATLDAKEQADQNEKERLQKLFASSLSKVIEDKSDERFSEKWYLRRQLSPYLDEYPFLAEDIPTLTKLRDFLNTPQAPAINYALGVFDAWDPEAEQRRDLQIRQILSEAKRRHS